MKTLSYKLQITCLLIEHKFCMFTNDISAQQLVIEKMIGVRTEMRIQKEQDINNLLFK